MQQAQVERARLVTVRDLNLSRICPSKKTPCIPLCSHSQKYLQTFQFSLVWLSRGQFWCLHIIWVTWFFYLHWIASWSTCDVSTGGKEQMRRVTGLDEAIKIYLLPFRLKYYRSFWTLGPFSHRCLQSIRRFYSLGLKCLKRGVPYTKYKGPQKQTLHI